VPIALVEEQLVAELVAELAPLEMAAARVSKALFDAMNPGRRLLVPEGLTYQGYTRLTYNGQLVAYMNVNVPRYRPEPRNDPAINRLGQDNLITWENNEGELLYHIPMIEAKEELAPVVFAEGNRLEFGLVDGTGRLDPASINDYWQEMPTGAAKAVMGKYLPDNTVCVTFWDNDGKQLEDKRLRIVTLPSLSTPTPEASKTSEAPSLSEWGLSLDGQKYLTVDTRYGLPAKTVVGIFSSQEYYVNGEKKTGLIGLDSSVIRVLEERARERGVDIIPLPFDPRGQTVRIEEGTHPYDNKLKFVGFKGLAKGMGIMAVMDGDFRYFRVVETPNGEKVSGIGIDNSQRGTDYHFWVHALVIIDSDLKEGDSKSVTIGDTISKLGDKEKACSWFPGGQQLIIDSADLKQDKLITLDLSRFINSSGHLVFILP
jgi:hypothetical protein